jgi:hypothetical protein
MIIIHPHLQSVECRPLVNVVPCVIRVPPTNIGGLTPPKNVANDRKYSH